MILIIPILESRFQFAPPLRHLKHLQAKIKLSSQRSEASTNAILAAKFLPTISNLSLSDCKMNYLKLLLSSLSCHLSIVTYFVFD